MTKQLRDIIRKETKTSVAGWKNEVVIRLLDALDDAVSRAEALERAIVINDCASMCASCKYYLVSEPFCALDDGQLDCRGEYWQFDHERFAGGEQTEICIGK